MVFRNVRIRSYQKMGTHTTLIELGMIIGVKTAKKEYNLTAIVVFITLVAGLAIHVNIIAHPTLQPAPRAVICL
jgi:hypothetical protein